MTPDGPAVGRRRCLRLGGLAASGALAGCLGRGATGAGSEPTPTDRQATPGAGATITIKQDAGRLVYWVLPGTRRLSERVFGTPDDPKSLVEPVIERAESRAMKDLLREYPILVGVPAGARVVRDDAFVRTTFPTPFGDDARVVDGEFELALTDRTAEDAGKPTTTNDDIDLAVRFTDPARNNYELEILTPFAPPVPGYRTGGGVRTDFRHHGLTGTGTPLMPRVYSPGAFWALGNVVVDGEVVDRRKVVHFMETQVVRTQNYRLAVEEELPLSRPETIAGRLHHMHAIVEPVTVTKQGRPVYEPVQTGFAPEDGTPQPFIHVMFEEDEIVASSFEVDLPRPEEPTPTATPAVTPDGRNVVEVSGREYSFQPERIGVERGTEVTVRFRNLGTIAHNFTVERFGARTPTIQPGRTASVTFTPDEVGEFHFECAVPGHEQQGMVGTLVVTP